MNKSPLEKNEITSIIVFYHKNCCDGLGAQFMVNTFHKRNHPTTPIAFYPIDYSFVWEYTRDKILKHKADLVWFVDFTPRMDDIENLPYDTIKQIMVADHHKGLGDQINTLMNQCIQRDVIFHCVYEEGTCGTENTLQLIGNYDPEIGNDKSLKRMGRLFGDWDCWRDPHNEEVKNFHYGVDSDVLDPVRFNIFGHNSYLIHKNYDRFIDVKINDGRVCYNWLMMKVKDAINPSNWLRQGNYDGKNWVELRLPKFMVSETADLFLKTYPGIDIVVVQIFADFMETISMRSRNGTDVSEICKRFGGGGHSGAAGIPLRDEKLKERFVIEFFADKAY